VSHVVTLKYSPNVDMPCRLTEEIEICEEMELEQGGSSAGKIMGVDR
jgi:hypothetical protein